MRGTDGDAPPPCLLWYRVHVRPRSRSCSAISGSATSAMVQSCPSARQSPSIFSKVDFDGAWVMVRCQWGRERRHQQITVTA